MTEERDKAIKCLRKLRNYLTDDEDLKLPIHDEKFLIRFVRAKKYDAELAHTTVRKYYHVRQKNPSVFKIAYPNHDMVREVLETNIVTVLKHKDPSGRPVVVYNPWDAEKHNVDQLLAASVLVVEELLMTTLEAQINGIVVLMDLSACSLQHIKQYTPKRMKLLAALVQGSFPMRLKGIHSVHEPTIVDIVLSALRPMMTEKSKNRVVFYGKSFEKLHELFPVDILPETFGGILGEEEAYDKDFIKRLISRDHYYQELLGYGYGNWESDDEDTYM